MILILFVLKMSYFINVNIEDEWTYMLFFDKVLGYVCLVEMQDFIDKNVHYDRILFRVEIQK